MNRVLAGILRFLNGFIALFIIIVCAGIGAFYDDFFSIPWLGAMAGTIVGLFVAVVLCGFIAAVLEIRTELRKIRAIFETLGETPADDEK